MKEKNHNGISAVAKKVIHAIKFPWLAARGFLTRIFPERRVWRAAAIGSGVLGYLIVIVFAVDIILPAGWHFLIGTLILLPLVYGLGVFLILSAHDLLLKLPRFFLWLFFVGFLLSMTGFGFFDLPGLMMGFLIAMLGALVGAGLYLLATGAWRSLTFVKKGIWLTGLILGFAGILLTAGWLLSPGKAFSVPDAVMSDPSSLSLAKSLPDPSTPGLYPVRSLYYGSGTDQRRTEFGEDVAIVSKTVDGSMFINNWTGLRTFQWGFDQTELPLNGRVWFPDASGRFPLILIVHGNHTAEDYSDPGYAYLCELLASRGAVCVSVDENFLNGSIIYETFGLNFKGSENNLRGWLLLEHLVFWEELIENDISPFHDLVDFGNIALIGHSRGGEAAAVAAAFNRLEHYPDNGKLKFDYGFDIQSVVAIAPIDRQYQPAGEPIPVTDFNYFVLHGSHDMDVKSFDGYNAYERAILSPGCDCFKSTLYIWGANHGQFNSLWGDKDMSIPLIWLYNRAQLIDEVAQMKIAQVYISAFVEATLKGEEGYLPLFQNYQSGLAWLPETGYINAYADSHVDYLLTYEEDIDLTTGSVPGIRVTGKGLETWHEDRVSTKWGSMQSNSAVYVRWNRPDSQKMYEVESSGTIPELAVEDQLIFSVGALSPDGGTAPLPVEFSLALIDSHGEKAKLPLGKISPLPPAFEAEIMKFGFLSKDQRSEVVFQTYLFPLSDFVEQNNALDLSKLVKIQFIFGESKDGYIALDNIGFRRVSSGSAE